MGVLLFLGLAALVAVYADDSCPPSNAISPCTCDGEGMNCMSATSIDQIRKAFKANFKFGGVRSVWIQSTPITSIPGDLFSNVKYQECYLEVNRISSVDMDAFSASSAVLKSLSFFGNNLTYFNYGSLTKFHQLLSFNLGRNGITSIPANAFSHNSLSTVILAQNKISSIGSNAFKGMPNIQKIDLMSNSLRTLGANSFALTSHAPGLQLSMADNQISNIDKTAFDGASPQVLLLTSNNLTNIKFESFGAMVNRMGQHGGIIDISGNPLNCRGCEYEWMVMNKHVLSSIYLGFRCTNGKTLQQLTRIDIGC